jgi:hypothetical protein
MKNLEEYLNIHLTVTLVGPDVASPIRNLFPIED